MTLGITLGARSPFNTNETHEAARQVVPAPQDIQELVNAADMIVLGTITSVIAEGPFAGYDSDGHLMGPAARDTDPPMLPSQIFWRTDFAITPISVLKGSSPTNGLIILREPNTWTTSFQLTYKHLPLAGQQLFFLTRNPDNQTYGASIWQKIILDGTHIRYLNAAQTIPEFARNQTAEQFLTAVNAVIALLHQGS